MPQGCPTAGCGCTNFQADAFKKDKCCNCFHNHGPGAGGAPAAAKAPAPAPPAKKPNPSSPPSTTREMKAEVRPPLEAQKSSEKSVHIKVEAKPEEKKAPGPPTAATGKTILKIAWHQSTRSEQFQIDVSNIQNLEQLDSRLRSAEASLAGKKFEYLCRGQVVAKVFWDIFKPEHLFPILFLQEDASGDNRTRFKPAAPSEKKTGFVAPSSSSPGFSVPTKVTFQKPVVKVAAAASAAPAAAKPAMFKADEAWFASRPPLFS